jgi:hypothetical protein
MAYRLRRVSLILLIFLTTAPLHATVSRQHADALARKIASIQELATVDSDAPRRTPVSEDEVNSWLEYRAQSVLPAGVSGPQITMVGPGRIAGVATVDLEVIARRRTNGGPFDPWSYLGGRVPVTVSGRLHSQNGVARFELETAEVSGVSVPKAILDELLAAYARTPDNPKGFDMGATFRLPASIDAIEVGQGQAVVIQ